jgi:hypothetical protein
MARKAFVADEATREKVRYLAGLGIPQDDIAKITGCAPKTLRKRFRDELDRGVAEANAMICGYLFAAAKAGNTTAQIFWLKTRAGWRERASAGAATQDRVAEPHPQAVLVLPDNNRDPELTSVLRDAQAKYFARKQRQSPETNADSALATMKYPVAEAITGPEESAGRGAEKFADFTAMRGGDKCLN